MAINKALFSSKKEEWETPQDFFDKLNKEFNFDLDPCADSKNAKCRNFSRKRKMDLKKIGKAIVYLQSTIRQNIYGTVDRKMC